MLKTVRHIEEVTYRSEVRDNVKWVSVDAGINGAEEGSALPPMARVIEWADAHPHVYAIVNETRSAAFGKDAIYYYGIDRGEGLSCMLGRIRTFQRLYENLELTTGKPLADVALPDKPQATFHQQPAIQYWLARHTYWIYEHCPKELLTGCLVQWDGKYTRNTAIVDFTRKSFGDVLGQFIAWCDGLGRMYYHTDRIYCCAMGEKRVQDMTSKERAERTVWTGCRHPSKSRKLNGELVCDKCNMTIEVI
jgi:hypothetical protein